jgi:hypothetical protein
VSLDSRVFRGLGIIFWAILVNELFELFGGSCLAALFEILDVTVVGFVVFDVGLFGGVAVVVESRFVVPAILLVLEMFLFLSVETLRFAVLGVPGMIEDLIWGLLQVVQNQPTGFWSM